MLLLEDALESGNAAYLIHAFAVVARARGMSELALAAGIDRAMLYRAIEAPALIDVATLAVVLLALQTRLIESGSG